MDFRKVGLQQCASTDALSLASLLTSPQTIRRSSRNQAVAHPERSRLVRPNTLPKHTLRALTNGLRRLDADRRVKRRFLTNGQSI